MFRSQVAEALFERVKGNGDEVRSCGTCVEKEGLAGRKLEEFSELKGLIETMKEKGFDITENTCTPITPELVDWADKIISMAEKSESPDYLLSSPKVTFWKVENPNNFTKEKARDVVEQIERLISIDT